MFGNEGRVVGRLGDSTDLRVWQGHSMVVVMGTAMRDSNGGALRLAGGLCGAQPEWGARAHLGTPGNYEEGYKTTRDSRTVGIERVCDV